MRELLGTAAVIIGSGLAAAAWFIIPELGRRPRKTRMRALRELDPEWMAARQARKARRRDRRGGSDG